MYWHPFRTMRVSHKISSDMPLIKMKKLSRSGFTLIEIAVVLAIIGMVMLLVIPRLPSSDDENLKISARTLASTLRYLQERAATSRTSYYLLIKPGTEFIKIFEIGGDGSALEPSDPLMQKSPIKEGIVISDVRIPRLGKVNDGELRVDVSVAGIRDFVAIHLCSNAQQFQTVMIFPSGGKVKIYDGYLEEPL